MIPDVFTDEVVLRGTSVGSSAVQVGNEDWTVGEFTTDPVPIASRTVLDGGFQDVDTFTIIVRPTGDEVSMETVPCGITVSEHPVDGSRGGVEGELSDGVDELVEHLGVGDGMRSGAISTIHTTRGPSHMRLMVGTIELSVPALTEIDLEPHTITRYLEEGVSLVVSRVPRVVFARQTDKGDGDVVRVRSVERPTVGVPADHPETFRESDGFLVRSGWAKGALL
jgi:hypothetical protein